MAERDWGGPAFPVAVVDARYPGMTLRDYFAGQALLGILASPPGRFAGLLGAKAEEATAASLAFALSDAMLVERFK